MSRTEEEKAKIYRRAYGFKRGLWADPWVGKKVTVDFEKVAAYVVPTSQKGSPMNPTVELKFEFQKDGSAFLGGVRFCAEFWTRRITRMDRNVLRVWEAVESEPRSFSFIAALPKGEKMVVLQILNEPVSAIGVPMDFLPSIGIRNPAEGTVRKFAAKWVDKAEGKELI